ncbi:MAG TPA: gluconate 2-dehydrogenase subunit 3 family protein [Blastocatellia bacterium]|nr:gluconate 2-dehydrogenase subunit 3 family protein [Blastocatellia bacterium]HMZ17713.1 gluconate 2-dehydrogenase subunit 3 family protein [Blastocatellia bacterium]
MKLAAGAMVIPALPQAKPRTAARAQTKLPKFFTAAELALVDELSELIIPTDDHSPGARAAKCAEFIDGRLAELPDAETKQQWREGLASINRLSTEMHKLSFLKASAEQRIALLTRIAANERDPKTPEEKFFVELKTRVAHAYYTSKIGLRQELEYKGNTYLREFAGTDVSKG